MVLTTILHRFSDPSNFAFNLFSFCFSSFMGLDVPFAASSSCVLTASRASATPRVISAVSFSAVLHAVPGFSIDFNASSSDASANGLTASSSCCIEASTAVAFPSATPNILSAARCSGSSSCALRSVFSRLRYSFLDSITFRLNGSNAAIADIVFFLALLNSSFVSAWDEFFFAVVNSAVLFFKNTSTSFIVCVASAKASSISLLNWVKAVYGSKNTVPLLPEIDTQPLRFVDGAKTSTRMRSASSSFLASPTASTTSPASSLSIGSSLPSPISKAPVMEASFTQEYR
mmetsp:Transcript_52840/g.147126  ORF Transcript_52840/g.147126 Transcript_52840/m.147126 type:complete len:288 (-) Transcript_52840:2334-3197(-)